MDIVSGGHSGRFLTEVGSGGHSEHFLTEVGSGRHSGHFLTDICARPDLVYEDQTQTGLDQTALDWTRPD